jgi:XTP/dITP diphosphohydrolase
MKLWVATANAHKVDEIRAILEPEIELHSMLELADPPEIEESADSYLGNARLKAMALWNLVREPVMADDSGLEVDALNGRPGVHSMRFSAPNPTHEKNIDKLLTELGDLPLAQRTARFRCTVVYLDAGGQETSFTGTLEGHIGFARRGQGGFGFDPVFDLVDRGCSVAELPADEKNRISHRGKAVAALAEFLHPLR